LIRSSWLHSLKSWSLRQTRGDSLASEAAWAAVGETGFFEDRIGVVRGFIKKTQKTPAADLELARKRMKEMQQ